MKQLYKDLICHFRGHKTVRLLISVDLKEVSITRIGTDVSFEIKDSRFVCQRCGRDVTERPGHDSL